MEPDRQKKALYAVSLAASVTATFIGVIVMTIWHTKNPVLTTQHEWIFFMQYTTALLFTASGAGLLCAAHKQYHRTWVIGAFVLIYAGAIMIEYITGMNLGIDQPIITDYMHPDTAHPGRPAPNTALAFMCIGTAQILLAANQKKPHDLRTVIIGLIGFIVFALGAHAAGGYLQSVEKAYAWGTDTRMSVHTAVANMAIGLGLLSLSWYYQAAGKIARVPLWLPALICFIALQADLAADPDLFMSIVYILLVFCSLWFTIPYTSFIFAIVASILAILGLLVQSDELITAAATTNRLLVIGAIWIVAALIYGQRSTDRKFQRSEEYLRAIVDNTVEALITINDKGIVQSFNPACEKTFGYRADEVIGQNVNMLMPSPYHREHDQYIDNYLTTGERKIIGIGREVEGLRKDGTTFPMDLAVSEMNVGGKRFFSGIIRDITERRKTEEELLRSNTELERFAYIAAHDLQEPLRIITKSTEFLEEDYGDTLDEDARKFIHHAQTAAKRMRSLVRDLLEYSRIGTAEKDFETVSMREVAGIAYDMLANSIETHQATIEIDDALPSVKGNKLQLVRLYQNLISNGLKYNREGEKPDIRLNAREEKTSWVFTVKDNGIGIEREYCEQIFAPFKRLHTSAEYPGTGIGLSMCRRIVERHNGRIWVESVPGQGSTFSFTLPKTQ
ncbi:MAG: PAS domain S-box protein [Rhodospirillales bacterium]|nr:PAS domain S-box protein [Rhodospirillales bacterium]